jgi:N-methylhydantoinase A/oxoprolinase/acetone carboxylase beta subunit
VPGVRIGSDAGGTFTDLVASDGRVAKVPSTPDDPGRAVRAGIEALLGSSPAPAVGADDVAARPEVLAHGTTVATNALLERRGARVALVTTEGFADVIEIARQDRPSLYDPRVDRPEPIVPRAWRHEVRERLAADGSVLVPVDLATLPELDEAVEAVAVCFLHSDLRADHEQAVAAELVARGHDVSASSSVSPEVREYERLSTTVINAYLRPVCRAYLASLADAADQVLVMTSAGGLVPPAEGAERPAALLLSGPAGGVAAAAAAAVANGFPDAVTFDMGGTSTDVCLVRGGRPEPASEREVAGLPVRLPSLDVHTIGAGGGSIAGIDPGGALVVGPESAGAVPGPACYGLGGDRPTVTDADLVAGRLPEGVALPGIGVLDVGAARGALERAGVTAEGVLAVVDAHMVQAIRRVSVEQGVDPRGLALVAFGGAGPLHACALAEALDMPAVVVPARAGVLSAVGVLAAPHQVDLTRSWAGLADHTGLTSARAELASAAAAELAAQDGAGGDRAVGADVGAIHGGSSCTDVTETVTSVQMVAEVATWLDCRYAGQGHELRVDEVDDFHAEHERRNGYARPDHPVEVVAVRARAWRDSPVGVGDLPVPIPSRSGAVGPAVLAEPDCTIWVPPGWEATAGAEGALILRRVGP